KPRGLFMPAQKSAKPASSTTKPAAKAVSKPASKGSAKAVTKAHPVSASKPSTRSAKEELKKPAKAAAPAEETTKKKPGRTPKDGAATARVDDTDLSDVEAEFAEEPVATTEKVKPLRMKISKAKERALMKEFGLDETILSEEDMAKRRSRLKALIKLGKTRGYLTHGEISDHLPDKLVDAETLEVVISMLNDMGVAVYEQTPDAETLLLNNTGPTAATEEEAEEEAEAALSTVDSEFGRTTDPVRMYMREMGTVELLTREGEIEIAKRIEGGLMR